MATDPASALLPHSVAFQMEFVRNPAISSTHKLLKASDLELMCAHGLLVEEGGFKPD